MEMRRRRELGHPDDDRVIEQRARALDHRVELREQVGDVARVLGVEVAHGLRRERVVHLAARGRALDRLVRVAVDFASAG